ncbi:tim11p [Saccharomyces arboricola H-6]|uniref:ATP synthase F(0) complex subunit e, mitochondrial n=1 Tax=Saccharomyces arboricola (strain H-6 / AS 2.3317 / CBS 10644) TaxID=1160507 RepID=J8PJJ8_SACAR|nr:tim11p [Saccharomyces arboricola H-6]
MSTVNVLRYSALGLGLFFGFRNDMILKCNVKKKDEQAKYEEKLKLVDEAKKEYAKLQPVVVQKDLLTTTSVNLEDPNIDFEKVILNAVESLKETSA